ncbi:glycoprotease family-domain-containing protein [Suillus americanus]|nr:glycoprotease family-domain-containing protein [Suillus americanus]
MVIEITKRVIVTQILTWPATSTDANKQQQTDDTSDATLSTPRFMPILESGLHRQSVSLLRPLRDVPRTVGRSNSGAHTGRRTFTVLGFESSADDTCAAVVTSSRQILSNVVVKQHDLHEGFGGIHPSVAIEAHQRNMPGAVRMALEQAHVNIHDVDGIAFTRGPGIGGCLSVGSNAAKSLAAALGKPLVGVHHMHTP